MKTKTQQPTIAEELDATRDHYRNEVIPAPALQVMDRETQALIDSGILDKSLKSGQVAPDFKLPNQRGSEVSLYDLLRAGSVVLTFYRGGWCPYCNVALRGLQRYQDRFAHKNTQLVAISPQLPDNTLSTAERNELSFNVLSDVGNKVANKYGIVFQLSEELAREYEKLGFGLDAFNGEEGDRSLPAPATFVIGEDRKIRMAFVEADYTKRLDPEEALAAL